MLAVARGLMAEPEVLIIDELSLGLTPYPCPAVGIARQYCGELGKQDNCQIAVTLSIANHHASLPVAYRIYLPKELGDAPRTSAQSCPAS